ncbi:MAG: hypothetical protein Q8L55_14220 [Phycisphaerales bacterium]|nr:hypothetical protein [Phycisphaerales bacterium]
MNFVGAGLAAARAMALVHDVGSSPADMGRQAGVLGGYGLLANNDFIGLFFEDAPLADVGRQGGIAPGDGVFDSNDFVVCFDAFVTDALRASASVQAARDRDTGQTPKTPNANCIMQLL